MEVRGRNFPQTLRGPKMGLEPCCLTVLTPASGCTRTYARVCTTLVQDLGGNQLRVTGKATRAGV